MRGVDQIATQRYGMLKDMVDSWRLKQILLVDYQKQYTMNSSPHQACAKYGWV